MTVPWTTEDLMVDLDEDVVSDPVQVRELRSGQPLRFRVHLARGGFFSCLEGRADRRWPRRWEVDAGQLAAAAAGALTLPSGATSDALGAWLDVVLPDGPDLIVRHPATAESLAALERRELLPVPGEVRELLSITDGLVVGGWAVLDVRDLHVVEIEGRSYWQVAVAVGSDDDRRCLLDPVDGLVVAPSHDAPAAEFVHIAGGIRNWIADLVIGRTDAP